MQRQLNISILLVVFFTFINAMVFFGLSIYHSVLAYIDIVHGHWEKHPGIVLVEVPRQVSIWFCFHHFFSRTVQIIPGRNRLSEEL